MFEQVSGIAVFIVAFGTACLLLDRYMMFRLKSHIEKANTEQEKQSKIVAQEIVDNVKNEFEKFEVHISGRLTDLEKNQLLTFSKIAQHDEELKYLNRATKSIKSDAEIREIVKQR